MTVIFIGAVMVVYGLVVLPLRMHRAVRRVGADRRAAVRSLAVGAGVAVLGAVLILTGVSH